MHSGVSSGLLFSVLLSFPPPPPFSLSPSPSPLSIPKGPMPNLKSKVALGWPDHTYLFEGHYEEDQEWVFVYHPLCNSRDTHMVGPAGGPDHQVH